MLCLTRPQPNLCLLGCFIKQLHNTRRGMSCLWIEVHTYIYLIYYYYFFFGIGMDIVFIYLALLIFIYACRSLCSFPINFVNNFFLDNFSFQSYHLLPPTPIITSKNSGFVDHSSLCAFLNWIWVFKIFNLSLCPC